MRCPRRPFTRFSIFALGAAITALGVFGCSASESGNAPDVTFQTPTAPPIETPTTAPDPSPAESTPDPTPTARTPGSGTALSCSAREEARDDLAEEVEDAMDGYDGEWGFALIDVACDASVTVNDDFFEYPASAGKIVTLVAALEAVESGELEDWEIESLDLSFRQVLRTSSDWDADLLEAYFDTARLDELLEEAGASDRSYMRESWKYSMMTPLDLATFWAAILKGELLEDGSAEYLLDLASRAEIPEEYETFPGGDFELDGFQYGQKAGYYVEDGVPYYFAGAGFLRELEGEEAFAVTFMIKSDTEALFDPQRRTVFPLVVEHVLEVTGKG